MFTSIANKILKRLKRVKNTLTVLVLKKKIRNLILSNEENSIPFLKLILNYVQIQHKNYEFVALGYLKKKIQINQSKDNLNPIEYLLPKQEMPLPSFFRNNISSFNVDQCLGIGEHDNQQAYNKTVEDLLKKTNNLDCNHFLNLISEKKPFHYLKFTHGFWDNAVNLAIKEYALKNGNELILNDDSALFYHIYNNNLLEDLFKIVNLDKFLSMIKNKDIYFCPTTSNGSIGSKIEFKILRELSKKNFLYHYSQVMLIEEFSKHKEITSSNIFKKIACTDLFRDIFLKKIKEYDLILICNHRAASKISKIYPYFKRIYCLPDRAQDVKHHANPVEFAKDVCKSVLDGVSTKPTLILSQATILSTFISYEILSEGKIKNISLIDIGKPLQTLFSPEITGGGQWRDKENLKHEFNNMSHLISDDLLTELDKDTKVETKIQKIKFDMDIERKSFDNNKTLY